jgi:hypothetical protein
LFYRDLRKPVVFSVVVLTTKYQTANPMDAKSATLKAVVTSVEGPKGREYVVCKLTSTPPPKSQLPKEATVTFSLSEWSSEHAPKRRQFVLLGDIEEFQKGWRARSAEPVRA